MSARIGVVFAILLMTIVGAAPASAHDSSPGATHIEVNDQRLLVTARVGFVQLGYEDTSGDNLIDIDELRSQESQVAPQLVSTIRQHLQLTVDGTETQIVAAGVPLPDTDEEFGPATEYVSFLFTTGPHDGDVSDVAMSSSFEVESSEVVLTSPDEVVVASLGDDGTASFALGRWVSARSFFELGVDHIVFGLDHLLFLLVLTLAVAGRTVTRATTWSTVKLVTAFTVGHAASLCLAYFDVVSVPAGIVEPAISLSIVAAAVLAIRGQAADARPWIAAIIGLIHGLGFASSLGSMGVATSQRAWALASFNLGIDVAQTAVVLLVIGALWVAAKLLNGRVNLLRVPVATAAGIMGAVWTVTRIGGSIF